VKILSAKSCATKVSVNKQKTTKISKENKDSFDLDKLNPRTLQFLRGEATRCGGPWCEASAVTAQFARLLQRLATIASTQDAVTARGLGSRRYVASKQPPSLR